MPYIHTETELDVIQTAIRKGWHIVPFDPNPGPNKKRASISWGYTTDRAHLTTMDEVRHWDSRGRRMAFVLSTANVALVDIDCAVPLYADQRGSRDYDDHRDDIHEKWDELPFDTKWEILTAIENCAIKAGFEPHASTPSSSRNGYHGYYHCKTRKTDPEAIRKHLTKLSTGDPCVEFYCNWRLAYPSNWEVMVDVMNAEPLLIDKVEAYWSKVADEFNTYRILKRQHDSAPPVGIIQTNTGGYTTDYHKLVENSHYAQIGKKCRLYVWLTRALQLDDQAGYDAGIQDAYMNGLTADKIEVQARGARATAARHPCLNYIAQQALDNYKLDI